MSESAEIRKRIEAKHAEIQDILNRMGASGLTVPQILQHHAIILDLIARQQEVSTRRIIWLTWALAFLTFGLLVIAGFQTRYMYLDEQRKHPAERAEDVKPLKDKAPTENPIHAKP